MYCTTSHLLVQYLTQNYLGRNSHVHAYSIHYNISGSRNNGIILVGSSTSTRRRQKHVSNIFPRFQKVIREKFLYNIVRHKEHTITFRNIYSIKKVNVASVKAALKVSRLIVSSHSSGTKKSRGKKCVQDETVVSVEDKWKIL